MAEAKRFDLSTWPNGDAFIVEDEIGDYVEFEAYASLRSQLTAANQRIAELEGVTNEADWLFSSMLVPPAGGTVPHDWRKRLIRWMYAQKARAEASPTPPKPKPQP